MKLHSHLAAALKASALLALVACKPNAATADAKPEPTEASATAASKTESNNIPQNVLGDLLKKAQAPEPEVALPDVVAIVEGQEIKKGELESALSQVLASQGIPPNQLPAAQKTQAYQSLLKELILERLVDKRSAEFVVKDEDVNGQIEKIKSRFPSPEVFKEQLEKAGQTLEKLTSDIRASLRQQNWIEEQIKDAPKATDADAEEFYAKNPQQFEKPEQVRASHILIAVAKDAAADLVSEKQKTAEAIADRVKKGEAFDKLASELSEDPSAKQNAGDLDFFVREQMVPEFSTAAFSMKKGEISAPVRSQFGFHIINVTDRKDAEKMTLESVKPQLLAFLSRRKHDEQVQTLLNEIREKAQVEVKLP